MKKVILLLLILVFTVINAKPQAHPTLEEQPQEICTAYLWVDVPIMINLPIVGLVKVGTTRQRLPHYYDCSDPEGDKDLDTWD